MEMVHFIPPGQRRHALLAAQTDTAPTLICGASGTGKGAIAKWIHQNGPRATKAFLMIDHNSSFIQSVAKAQGGTLVISEIGEWSLSEQLSILHFLKSKTIPHPENPNMNQILNVRIIATTDQALEGRAQGGLFNSELLEHLNIFRIEMPPLSYRTEEFNDIVMGIRGEITRELHKEHLKNISPIAWEKLKSYDWPGNLRELRNVLKLAILAAKGDQIELEDLPDFGHEKIDFRATREKFEKIYLIELLRSNEGDLEKTCKDAGMDQNTLLNKLRHYQINPAQFITEKP